jgi:hypothetical protein
MLTGISGPAFLELGDEIPDGLGGPGRALAWIFGRRVVTVAAGERAPTDGMPSRASGVSRADKCATSRRRLGRSLRSAAVVLDESVATHLLLVVAERDRGFRADEFTATPRQSAASACGNHQNRGSLRYYFIVSANEILLRLQAPPAIHLAGYRWYPREMTAVIGKMGRSTG